MTPTAGVSFDSYPSREIQIAPGDSPTLVVIVVVHHPSESIVFPGPKSSSMGPTDLVHAGDHYSGHVEIPCPYDYRGASA